MGELRDPVGEAPVSVVGVEPGVLASYTPATAGFVDHFEQQFGDFSEAPGGLRLTLTGCTRYAPGVAGYHVIVEAVDSVAFPQEVFLSLRAFRSDTGWSAGAGTATIAGPGAFTLVTREAIYNRVFRDLGVIGEPYANVRFERDDRVRTYVAAGSGCELGAFTNAVPIETEGRSEFVDEFRPLEVTAPRDTLQAVMQQVDPTDPGAPLSPLLVAYGNHELDLFAEHVFLPDLDDDLLRIEETLASDSDCRQVTFTYPRFRVRQERDCVPDVGRAGTWEAGLLHFAIEQRGPWQIVVSADSAELTSQVIESVTTLGNLEPRPLPDRAPSTEAPLPAERVTKVIVTACGPEEPEVRQRARAIRTTLVPFACAETHRGTLKLSRWVRDFTDDRPDQECISTRTPDGGGGDGCRTDPDQVVVSGGGGSESATGYARMTAFVPEEASSLVVVTARGDEVRSPVINEIGFSEWALHQGSMIALYAEINGDLVELDASY